MTDPLYIKDTCHEPNFAGLMNLYGNNYRLLTTLLECLEDSENSIRSKDGYILKIDKKHQSRYTQNIDLHYSFHARRKQRKIAIAIASFKVRVYLDTCQAEVTLSEVELKKPFPIYGLFLSLRTKWYYNQCLRAVLRSFFAV